ncbi:MAG: hypothetical protein U0836_00810 [Pirellulales bacterium]
MIRAIALKELREVSVFAGLGLAALLFIAASQMGWNPFWTSAAQGLPALPFLGDSFRLEYGGVAILIAAALGLWQTLGDYWGGAQLFLFHRPISRRQYVRVKLVTGLLVYLAPTAVPVLIYGWWAGTPGTHHAPFFWSMTLETWQTWLAGAAVYLGAFLSGLRPAAWLGTRLAPLVASLMVVFPLAMFRGALFLPVFLAVCALLVWLILFVADERELS